MKCTALAAMLVAAMLGFAPPAHAWKVDWKNHRDINVRIVNQSGTNLNVSGSNYQSVTNKIKEIHVPAGGEGHTRFTFDFKDFNNVSSATARITQAGGKLWMCQVEMFTEDHQYTDTIKHWWASPAPQKNCKVGIDPKYDDLITITILPTAKPYPAVPDYSKEKLDNCKAVPLTTEDQGCDTSPGDTAAGDTLPVCYAQQCYKCPDGWYVSVQFRSYGSPYVVGWCDPTQPNGKPKGK
ncbi:hypothetical protein [Usitatibacter palustris]|uniref:Uncharacterized protein n=1 Tax=Usitatibacter palustris TaxID=2732487 RepID=A0A6M4H2A3_9PROT|nr:hypothetical protein [Usitatibacter palustris]QJR13671.1 hypothetical protein DSM104440_00457 [Usitatibacter palustris]